MPRYQIGDVELQVHVGSVLELAPPVEALVCPADFRLSVSKKLRPIRDAAGISSLSPSSKLLHRGDIVFSHAGALAYRCVLMWVSVEEGSPPTQTLSKGFENLLPLVKKHGIRSIAFPALGTGQGGLSFDEFAEQFLSILCRSKLAPLQEVFVALLHRNLADKFNETIRKYACQGQIKLVQVEGRGLSYARVFSGIVGAEFNFTLPDHVSCHSARLTLTASADRTTAFLTALHHLASLPLGNTVDAVAILCSFLGAYRNLPQALRTRQLEEQKLAAVQTALPIFYQAQNDDGGWGWYPATPSHPLMTAYALCAVSALQKNGYPLDRRRSDSAISFLQQKLDALEGSLRALVVYALGEFQVEVEMPTAVSPLQLALMMLHRSRQRLEPAQEFLPLLLSLAHNSEDSVYWGESGSCSWDSEPVETTAWAIRAVNRLAPDHPFLAPALRWLLLQRRGGGWKSSRDSAACALALSENVAAPLKTFSATVAINQQKLGELACRENDPSVPCLTISPPKLNLHEGDNRLSFTSDTPMEIYCSGILTYHSPTEAIPRVPIFTVERTWHLKGAHGSSPLKPGARVSIDSIIQSQVHIHCNRDVEYLVLTDSFPPGAELLSTPGNLPGQVAGDYRQLEENHVATFFSRMSGNNPVVIAHSFRLNLPGDFKLEPATIRLLYFPDVWTATAGFAISVTASSR